MTSMLLSGFLAVLSAQDIPFEPPKDIANGSVSGISSMDAGDINNDGLVDVVCIEGGKHAGGRKTFAWFQAPANTQGSWTRHNFNHSASLRSFLGSAKLRDMDNDGDLDLVVSSDNHSGGTKAADVFVFVNPGGSATGTWNHYKANSSTMAVHHINDMEIADLDNDGKKDIIVRSLDPNQIHIFFQNSISSWTRKSIDTGISASEGLSVGNLDGNARPDITFTGYWLKAPSNPRTQNYTKLPIDSGYKDINQNTKEAVGDIDGDGIMDVVIGPAEAYRNGGNHVLAWYRNPGTSPNSNWQRTVIKSNTNNSHTVKLGDMDGDGDLDVVVGIAWSSSGTTKSVLVYRNNGSGGFGAAQVVNSGKGLYSGVVADLGNDGDLDIIGQDTYSGTSKPWIYENLTAGSAPSPPSAPTNLSATAASETAIDLAWTDGSNNENGFRIDRAASSGGPWSQVATVGANVTAYTNTGLSPSTTYYYRVRAYNGDGNSPWSNVANATTPAAPSPPAAPSGLSATAVSTSAIDLSWTDNSNDETGFKIERSTGGGFTQVATVGAGVTSWSDTGLTASTTYSYRVRATNAVGNSSYSNTATATTQDPPPSPPAAPSGLSATAVSSTAIDLAWTDNSNDETGFKIERSTGGGFTQVATVGAGVTAWSDSGLPPSTVYTYRVRATNSAGNSSYSNTATATTLAPPATAPSAPSGLLATTISESQIDLSWTDTSDDETEFRIERDSGSGFIQIATVGAGVTAWSDTGLAPSTAYAYRVRAANSAGTSGYSNTATATTLAGTSTLPPPWVTQDIGAVAATGDATFSAGTFTIDGSGADIWSTADEFRYVYQDLTGDGSIIARVVSQTNPNGWAKAGPMIRETTAADSKSAIMALTPSNGATYDRRTATGGTTSKTVVAGTTPMWTRLTRDADLLTGYISPDGIAWIEVDNVTITMASGVLVGMAVTAHNDGAICTALFDNVMVVPGVDFDGDGMSDADETTYGLDGYDNDQDANGTPDGLDDWDSDGIPNHEEVANGTSPGTPPGATPPPPTPTTPPAPAPGPTGWSPEGGHSDGDNGKHSKCGATGAEFLLLGLLLAVRRKRMALRK